MLPADPEHVLIGLDVNSNGDTEVYSVNLASGHRKIVEQEERGIQFWATGPTSELRLSSGFRGRKTILRVRDPNGDWVYAHRLPWFEDYEIEGFDNDPDIAFASKYGGDGTLELHRINLWTGESLGVIFESENFDFSGLKYDEITMEIVGVSRVRHFPETTYFNADYAEAQKELDILLPNAINSIIERATDGHTYFVRSESTVSPGSYYVYDSARKTLKGLTQAHTDYDPTTAATTQYLEIPARDGTLIPTYTTSPKETQKLKNMPTIILPHGGPYGVRDDARWDYSSQYYASLGYLVVKPNFRGSGGYGRAFEQAGNQQWGGLMQDDITDVTRWLIGQNIADPDRICIIGGSYGGYAALMGAIKEPSLYKCAVSVNGVTDLKLQKRADRVQILGGWRWIPTFGLEGTPDAQVSPYHRASDINIPVLTMAAVDDARVHYKRSEDFHQKLLKLGKRSQFVRIERGGHSLNTQQSRYIKLKAIRDFLAKHIGPKAQITSID